MNWCKWKHGILKLWEPSEEEFMVPRKEKGLQNNDLNIYFQFKTRKIKWDLQKEERINGDQGKNRYMFLKKE